MRNYIFENHRIVNDVEQAAASQACHFASNERGLITIRGHLHFAAVTGVRSKLKAVSRICSRIQKRHLFLDHAGIPCEFRSVSTCSPFFISLAIRTSLPSNFILEPVT